MARGRRRLCPRTAAASSARTTASFALDGVVGVGSPATNPVVVGGVFRADGYVGLLGADMSVALRVATRGLLRGRLGAGARSRRRWRASGGGGATGSTRSRGSSPSARRSGSSSWSGADWFDVSGRQPSAEGGFVALEIDFLRLTSMRSGETTKVWSNPAPANAPPRPSQRPRKACFAPRLAFAASPGVDHAAPSPRTCRQRGAGAFPSSALIE